ncbi:MAG: glycyl-radical enzyme activating protein [Candidatus Melainabacteria bacterium]|nr:glycyl-radical enzyme activating protein [Candidatus Melainabacteria bacterium]
MNGNLFDIQKFSVADGPGIRTLVFFKGCPLRCSWCANPEGQEQSQQLLFYEERCNGCGLCLEGSNHKVHSLRNVPDTVKSAVKCLAASASNNIQLDKCPREALVRAGFESSVSQVLQTVLEDLPFYVSSGGGVTLGGGEPAMQPEFALALLSACKQLGIHRVMETCGYASWELLEPLLNQLDLLLFDLKHMDNTTHKAVTGVSNEPILNNLEHILSSGKTPVVIRIPIVPGINATKDNILATAAFLHAHDKNQLIQRVDLLPYHRLGMRKYERLGREYHLSNTLKPDRSFLSETRNWLGSFGFDSIVEAM